MKYPEHNFQEFDDAAKSLFIALFGKEMFDTLNSTPVKAIDWKGLDIDKCFSITATTPNIKDRFNQKWLDYFSERGYTMFDLFLESVHHYGYYNAWSREQNSTSNMRDLMSKILNQNEQVQTDKPED